MGFDFFIPGFGRCTSWEPAPKKIGVFRRLLNKFKQTCIIIPVSFKHLTKETEK